jgi:hypothetical protein
MHEVQQEHQSLNQQLAARDRVRSEKQTLQRYLTINTTVDKIEQILRTE